MQQKFGPRSTAGIRHSELRLTRRSQQFSQMACDEQGFFNDTLVILIFVYLTGAATVFMGMMYWNRNITSFCACRMRRGPGGQEVPPPPQPVPEPIPRVERVYVVAPPPSTMVGITASCYAYHRNGGDDNRCNEMSEIVQRYPGARVTKRFHPCRYCYPEGTYHNQDVHLVQDGLPRGVRPRRTRDNVPLQVSD